MQKFKRFILLPASITFAILGVVLLMTSCTTPVRKMQNCVRTGEDAGNTLYDCEDYAPAKGNKAR